MKIKKILGVFLVLLLLAPGILAAEETQVIPEVDSTGSLPEVKTYEELLASIRKTRSASQARIEAAAGKEKVREAWETGRLIDEHILHHQERAEYGKQVILRLARDLGTSDTELRLMLQFARAYPICPHATELSWSEYRDLLALNDPKERDEIAKEAQEKNWTRDQIRKKLKARKESGKEDGPGTPELSPLKPIEPGPLDTYGIVRLKDSLKIDLGFGIYRDLPPSDDDKFHSARAVKSPADGTRDIGHEYKAGDIVISSRDINGVYSLSRASSQRSVLNAQGLFYTYKAQAVNVVDGDTFHALIDLGFGTTLAQRVRLRRIDAPEILTAEGKEARDLLEKILARDKGRVTLQSRELDQHGRPIADVWVLGKPVDQELLDQGLAVKLEE